MRLVSAVVVLLVLVYSPLGAAERGFLRIHYLGHAAFVLEFDNGVRVLTDYGKSLPYGLESPIFGLGGLKPDIVTCSHAHEDHDGGRLPEGIPHVLRDGRGLTLKGLSVRSIPTYERSLGKPDNFAYQFDYKGFRILHAGDCQALIINSEKDEVRRLIAKTYPDRYDLVLLPVDYVSDITQAAAKFAGLLRMERMIPMHYWTPATKDVFFAALTVEGKTSGREWRIVRAETGSWSITLPPPREESKEAVSLTPGEYKTEERD
jgi:L-ascorbate metabolism protein UlaG (beta-lactamase superfamily)